MKKVLYFILMLCMITTLIPARIQASDETLNEETLRVINISEERGKYQNYYSKGSLKENSSKLKEFDDIFYNAIKTFTEDDVVSNQIRIRFNQYNVKYDELYLYSPFIPYGTEFYVDFNDTIYQIVIDLNQSSFDEYMNMVEYTKNHSTYILNEASKLNTDFEKALFVHDYLALNTTYDFTENCYSSSGPLYDHYSVCQGYSFAFLYLMTLLDIECHYVVSVEMNHGWNIINIDGEYYHVDITWDDPIMDFGYDGFSSICHEYFLVSDDAISFDHYGWASDIVCTSTKYDEAFYRSSNSMIQNDGSYLYYISNENTLYKRNLNTDEFTILYNFVYTVYTGIGLTLIGNKLYFNDRSSFYSINTDGTNLIKFYTPDSSDGSVRGMRYWWNYNDFEFVQSSNSFYEDDEFWIITDEVKVPIGIVEFNQDKLELNVGETISIDALVYPNYKKKMEFEIISSNSDLVSIDGWEITGLKSGVSELTIKVDDVYDICQVVVNDVYVEDVLYGDVNDDGKVNAQDRMMITRYIAKWSGYDSINLIAADVNKDGKVNAQDRMIITRHIARWSGYDVLPK